MKFNRIRAGHYATPDGRYAVIADITEETGEANYGWCAVNDGWCAVFDPEGKLREDDKAGENLDWFDTKREAAAYCRYIEERQEGI